MSEHIAPLTEYERPILEETEAARLINPNHPPSIASMRRYRARRQNALGFSRVFGRVLYSRKHIDDFLRCAERGAR